MKKVQRGNASNIFTSNQSVGFKSKMMVSLESSQSPVENSSGDYKFVQHRPQYLSTYSPIGQVQYKIINHNSEEPGSSVMQG